jgi:hypothetical protein
VHGSCTYDGCYSTAVHVQRDCRRRALCVSADWMHGLRLPSSQQRYNLDQGEHGRSGQNLSRVANCAT